MSGYEFGQIFALLLRTAVAAELVDAQIRMRTVRQADRGASPRYFLHRHTMLEIAEAGSAELLLDGDTVQAQCAHLRPQVTREDVFAIDRIGTRRNSVLCKFGDRLAQHVNIGA